MPQSSLGRSGHVAQRHNAKRKCAAPQRRRIFLEQLEERSLLAVMTWDGGSGNLWSTAANWVGDVAPQAGDDLVFPAGAANLANSNDLGAGVRFNTILIQGSGYNITGNAIELSGGLTANNVSGTNTFDLDTTLINAQTVMSANSAATLNFTGDINTANILGSYYFGTIPAIVFDGQGTTNATGVISGYGGVGKLGGGVLTLGGNNTYEGVTDARQGFIRVTHNNGLGSAATAHTEVQAGAAVELSGVNTAEDFAIREGGVGFGNGTDISSAGALRGVGGVLSTVTGNVELVGGNNLIGSASGSTLNLAGQILSPLSAGNRRLLLVGPGTVQFTGSQPNIYTGDTVVLQGRLELGKTGAGVDKAVPSVLIIGDNIGGDNAAEVRLIANDQIAQLNLFDAALNTITLNSSGVLNLNGFSDTLGSLVLTTGSIYSSDIHIGAGTLTLSGNLTLNAFQGSSGATPAATITSSVTGQFNLGDLATGGQVGVLTGTVRTITISDTQLTNIATDLDISANITGLASTGISKVGAGTLRLGGNNTFAGPFIWNNGLIEVNSNSAFGSGLIALQSDGGNTLRAIGGTRTISNPISVDANNTNFIGSDSFLFTGNVTLVTAAPTFRVMDPAQTVTFAGVIHEGIFGSRPLNKGGRGTMVLTAANTYSGNTTINQDGGTLILRGAGSILNSPLVTVSVGGVFQIDNNSGGNLADRINDAASMNVNGRLIFTSSNSANSSEYVGPLTPGGSLATTIELQKTSGAAFTSAFTTNVLGVGSDRTVNFLGTGVALSDSALPGANRFSSVNNPAGLDDGIVPMGLVTGPTGSLDFATYGSSPEGFAIIPLPAAAYVTDINLASATSNVRLSADAAVSTSKSVNAILFEPNVDLTGAGATLTVNSGRVIFTDGGSIGMTNLSSGQGAISVVAGTATISSNIIAGNVQKGGRGELVLSGDNQTGGAINVNEGVLEIQSSTALGAAAGTTTVRANATLDINGSLTVGLEPLNFTGAGFSANAPGSGLDTYASAVGALRNVSGDSTWAGNIGATGDATDLTAPTLLNGYPVIANGAAMWNIAAGSFAVSGAVSGSEVIKRGSGQLEFNGVLANTYNAATRILEGTLLLNKEPGINAVINLIEVGSEAVGAPAATLRLGGSDQISDGVGVRVHPSGLFDLNGNSELIGGNFELMIGPTNAGDVTIGAGGTLIPNLGTTVYSVGTGGAVGSTITGGTFALQVFGVIAGLGSRVIQANDGAVGTDLTITSAIVDGTGLQSVGIQKTGFGSLELGGTTANPYTGDTTVTEGTLLLNKGTGTGGVNAFTGRLFIGSTNGTNNDITSGFAGSDVVRWLQPNQLPDLLAPVDIANSGLLDLNGNNETIGQADAQNTLTLRAGAVVDMGGATLTLNGNINTNAAQGAAIWTPVVGTQIVDGTLALGGLQRVLDVPDRAELPFELEISANITGTGGYVTVGAGTILFSGNNSGLSGDIVRNAGNFAVGTDTAFGTSRVFLNNQVHFVAYNGERTLGNAFSFQGETRFLGGNNTAGSGTLGGGGNDLTFTGPVNIVAGTWLPTMAIAGQVEFAGGVGETLGGVFTNKRGFGAMIVSSPLTLSGNLEIGQGADVSGVFGRLNGGHIVLRDSGTWLNGTSLLIGYGGTLQIDNSGLVLANRIGDTIALDMSGGSLALVGKAGAIVGESMGALNLRENSSSSLVQALLQPAAGSTATWRFTNYSQSNANQGSSLQFVGRGTDITAAGSNRVAFNTLPGLTDAIIPTAVMSGSAGFDFATVTNATPTVTPFNNFLGALTGGVNFATTLVGATGAVNVKLAVSEAVAGAITANALLLPNGGLTVSGAGSLTLDAGLIASRGVGNTVSVATLNGAGLTQLYVDGQNSTLTIASAIGNVATTLTKSGTGLVELSGANTYVGTVRVSTGVLRASSNTAFGTTAGNIVIPYGGTIELNGVNVPAEQIFTGGFGEFNLAHVSLKALPGTNNTWNGIVQVDHNRTTIEVGAGGELIVVGQLNSGNGLNKSGAGILELQGGANNAAAAIIIWQGTLELNKTPASNAANGTITVGDNVGIANADRLVLLNTNQIQDTNNITVGASGLFDYGAFTETINLFSIQGGLVSSGTITGSTGALTIVNNSTIDLLSTSTAGGSAGPVTLGGTLVLGGVTPRVMTVADLFGLNDINMPAVLGASAVNFQKDGAGRLSLSGNSNAYAGSITLNGGETVVQHANALGTAAGNTQVNNNISLLIDGVSLAEPLNINGVGFGGQGVIRQISGASTTLSADVALAGNVNIGVDTGLQLIMSGAISGAFGVNKQYLGTLQFAGATSNTFTGTMQVQGGTLELNKTGGAFAVQTRLEAGNDSGAAGLAGINADVVRWLQNEQLAPTATEQLVANTEGLFDFNGRTETIAANAVLSVFARVGQTSSGRYDLNGGTLVLAGGAAQTTGTNTTGLTIAAPIPVIEDGTISLANANTGFIDVTDTLAPIDFIISATINNAGGGRIRKSGAGALALTGNNAATYNATTDLSAGLLALNGPNALGNAAGTLNIAAAASLMGVPGGPALVDGRPIALNAALTFRGTTDITLSGPLTNSVAANTITTNVAAPNTVTLSGVIALSNSAANNTLTITNSTFGGGVNSVVGGDMTVSGQIINGGTSTASNLTKAGTGLLTLSNNTNSYAGTSTVAAGVLRVTADNALGATGSATTNSTTVNNGATLAVVPGVNLPEWLVLNNNGLGNFGSLRMLDATPGTTETATVSGNINFVAAAFVGVDGGGANPDRLILNGTLASGANQTVKVGLGELEIAGASDNGVAFVGAPSPWDDGLLVRQGSVLFNKTGALRVIVGGTITVGDGSGGTNPARLILIGSGTDQIGGNLNIDVGLNGQLLLAGAVATESIGQLQVFRLGGIAGSVDTGTATLAVNANIFASNAGVTTAATPPVVIAGNLNLSGALRNVNASDSFALNPAEDLLITALISNGSINVNGDGGRSGTVAFTNAGNSYAGGTTVTGQTIDFNASFTHGTNVFVSGTLIARGGGVLGTGGVAVNSGATLVLDNSTTIANRIGNAAALTITGGTLTLIGNAGGAVTEQVGALTINAGTNAGIDSTIRVDDNGQVTELLAASLARGAGALVHFVGVDSDLQDNSNARIQITALPATSVFDATTATNGILPWATLSGPAGYDLVTDGDGATADNVGAMFIERFTGDGNVYDTDVNALTHGVMRMTGATSTLSAARTIRGLLLESTGLPGGLNLNGFALTVGTTAPGLIVSRGPIANQIINTGAATGIDFAAREPLFAVESNLNVSTALNGTGALRKERTAILRLSADSDNGAGQTFTGTITINAGTVTAANDDALGNESGAASEVLVNRRAALLLDATAGPLNLGNTAITVGGLGLNDDGTGALRTVGANPVTVGTGPTLINWNANPTIVHVGTGSTLDLNAVVSIAINNPVIKRGPGEMIYRGDSNTNTNIVTVNEGTLTLNKAAGYAIRNALTINDLGNYDDVGAALVQYGAGAGGDQIGNSEVQTITVPATVTTFTLTFNGFTTGNITRATATALDVQTALEGLGSIGPGNVSVSGVVGGPYTVTFTGFLASQNVAALTGTTTAGTGAPAFGVIDGALVTINVTVNANGTLALNGISDSINALTVNGGVVTTSGGNLATSGAIVMTGGSIATGAGSLIINNNEVQTITAPATITTFTLTFGGFTTGALTRATATGLDVQTALESLASIGPGNVSVSGQAGGPYGVTFTSVLGSVDVAQLTGTTITGTGALAIATPFNGGTVALTLASGLATNGPATISGNLNLNGASRVISVIDNYQVHNDLAINAAISNGRVIKTGNGALFLNNSANTFLAGANEIQRIVIAGTTAGTSQFNINFNGNVTTAITVNAVDATTAALIDAALEALTNVGPGGVNVTVAGPLTFNIEFTGHLGEQDVPNQIVTTLVVGPGTFTPSTLAVGGAAGINHTAGILSFSSNTALGTARVQLGNSQLLPVGGDRTIANSLALTNNVTTTFGGRRDFGGSFDLTVNGGVTLHSSTTALNHVNNLDVIDNQVNIALNGVISGGGDFIVPVKRGIGTMIWAGNNTFDVRDLTLIQTFNATDGIRVEGGVLRLAHSNALGNPVELASITSRADVGAVLELDGTLGDVNLPAGRIVEIIHQNDATHRGLFNRTSSEAVHTGVLRNIAGNNSIASPEFRIRNVNDAANAGTIFIGVDAGNLTISGQIVGLEQDAAATLANNKHISKTGAGMLTYSGSTPNLYVGTTAVFSGPMTLQKAPSVNAVSGPLVVGDNVGAANSDLLILGAAEQIADGAAVTVVGSGQLQASLAQAASLSNEVQQVFIPNVAPTGQFRLQFNGATTTDISFGASLASIQAQLNALATIGGAGGSVILQGTGSGQNQFFTVTFLGSLAGLNLPQLKVLAGTTAFAAVTPAVTTLTTGGVAGHETFGATTLRVATQGAGNISLQPGSRLGLQGDVIVDTYGALIAAATGAVITGGTLELRQESSTGAAANRTFTVADSPAVDDLRIDSTLTDGALGSVSAFNKAGVGASRMVLGGAGANVFTGSTSVSNGILQAEKATAFGTALPDEVQTYVVNNVLGAASGQYFLTFNAINTANLDPRATADEVAAALNAILPVGGSVSVVSITNTNTHLQYFIRFGGNLAGTDVGLITTNTGTLAGGATIGAGTLQQNGGVVNIAAAQTAVAGAGQLELENVGTVNNEQLTFLGSGLITENTAPFFNNGLTGAAGTGSVRNIAGNNTWQGTVAGQGNILLGGNPSSVGVVAGTTLTFGGLGIVAGAQSLGKTGLGTLELAGSVTNTYTGNTYVNEGTLLLNKSGAAIAINGGEIMVGDSLGGDNADVLLYAPSAGTDQIGNRVIRVTSSGLLNLNGVSDTNNNTIVLDVGPTISADVATGAGVLLNNSANSFAVVNQAGTTAASLPAVVAGIFDFGATAGRNFDVREGGALVELLVSANLQGGAGGFTKINRGTLSLTGTNTNTGTSTINNDSGTVLAGGTSASPFTVGAGSTLGGSGIINNTVTFNAVTGSNLTVGGILNPGSNSPAPANTGILTVNNNVTFNAGARYLADINGITVGTQYDQLLVTGTVTITGAVAPNNIANTATINGTTGNGFMPVNGVDAFKLISKTGLSTIANGNNSFLSEILPQLPQTSPTTVTVGGKTYTTSYNVGVGLNDGNDFVLQAVATSRVWDGRIDNNLVNVSDNWTLATNWVGDVAPFAGDDLVFNDVGLANGKNSPVNNFAAGTDFRSINFGNTAGFYTITGNSVLLNALTGGVTSDNLTNVAVTNNLNIALTTAANPQTITVKDGSTLNFGGAIALVLAGPLTVTNGAGVDANGSAVFNGTVNGGGDLNINMAGANGDATFNAAIGSSTALSSISVTTVDDLTFNSTIATTGNVTQPAGTGSTTLSGGTIGGTLTMTNEAIVLTGVTHTVTGAATLTATVGSITDGNAAANNVTAPSLALTAVTGIGSAGDPLETTITNFEAQTATGGVFLSNTGTLNVGNASAAITGVNVTGASGDISLVATGSINIITTDEDVLGPGNITLNAQGAASDVNTGGSPGIAPFTAIFGSGATSLVSITAGRDVVLGTATTYGDTASNGSILITAGRDFILQRDTFLDVNGTGTSTVNAGRDIILANDGSNSRLSTNGGVISLTANRNVVANVVGLQVNTIDSTQGGATPAGANVNITATTGSITLGDGVNAGTAGNAILNAPLGAITDTNINGTSRVNASALTATAATGVLLETAVTTVTSATVSGAGNVDFRELDAVILVTVTAANGNVSVNAGGAVTNAPAAVISATGNGSFTGSTVTLGNQAGDTINFATLTFNSVGAVNIAEDSSTQLTGTSTAGSLVLSSPGAITNAGAASATVTNNATFNAPSINLGTVALDAINFGSLTFTASAGGVTIEENSALDLLGANTATGAIVLTSVDAVAAGQNLTLPLGSTVQSTGSSVTLNAGDNATIAGNVTSALATTINVDFGDAETPAVIELVTGSGATLLITGVITTPAVGSGGGAFLNGNDDVDTFNFSPQTTTEFRLNGFAPAAADAPTNFDTLILNIAGTTNPNLTVPGSIAPYNGSGSGAWSFTSAHLPVLYTNIEDTQTIGNYHLTYDNSLAPIGNLFVVRDVTMTKVQLLNGANNGPLVYQGDLSTILSLRILGSAGNDIVTVDDIHTLPSFVGTVPGVTDNPNIPLASEFLFDGLGGIDTLVFNIIGATASQTYAIGSGTGAAGLQGEIDSTAAGISLLSYFQNVELTQRTGVGATPGTLSILGDLSGNTLATAPNGVFTQTTATGYTPFEFNGNNFSGLSVSGGLGMDSVELLGYGTGQTNPLATSLNGDGDVDSLRVHSTTGNAGIVTLNGGAGSDQFLLSNLLNTVNSIVGQVVVDGTDGNVGGNTDTLTIVDSGDTGPNTVLINTVNPAITADYRVEGITSTLGDDVILRNVDVLNYTGTQGNDVIDAKFESTIPLHDLSVVSLSGYLGADQFLLFTSDQIGGTGLGVTPTGVPSGVATINLYGDVPGNLNAGDGNDTFGETPLGLVGTGIMNVGMVVANSTRMIRPSVTTAIAIDGGQPTGPQPPTGDVIGDVLNLDITSLPNSASVVVSTYSPGTVVAGGIQPLNWTQIEDMNLVDQGKLTNLQMGDIFARTTAGNDLVQLTRNPTMTNPNQIRLRISATIANYSVTGKTLIYGGDGSDNITQSNLTVPAEFYGEGGDDVLSGAMNNDWLVGGIGNDRINASGGDNVVWGDNAPTNPGDPTPQDGAIGGNDILSGLGGNDVFYAGAGDDQVSAGGGNDYVSGGQGNDLLDGHDGDDRIYGGVGNDVIGGQAGNDLLSGGAGVDRVIGGTGNDVLFGGTGTDELTGSDGNDLLVTGTVANENSTWTSVASVSNYSPATYTNGADFDAALLVLLTQWASVNDRSSIGAITHDGVDDDVFGGLGDDDFCYEAADIADDFPALAPPDFDAFGMGDDDRFAPF